MASKSTKITVVGAGLAGSECAYQLAQKGFEVDLIEMRPLKTSPAHKTPLFAELVCSNSFGSQTNYSAPGQLKWEAERMDSLILKCAKAAAVPAGMALAMDREIFARAVTDAIHSHPNIKVRYDVVKSLADLPRPCVIATGPLTEDSLAQSLREHFGDEFLYFFDAIAPIISADSINMDVCWKGDRFGQGTNDYINCPLNKEQYFNLIKEIKAARKIESKEFEKTPYFDGCMPVEAIVERGDRTLRFGPLSPKGLTNPHKLTGEFKGTEFAVVQLRQDNKDATAYNMVGFQTKMAYGEQQRVFRMIPGLENAEFLKLGSIHRNLYIHSPLQLTKTLASKKDPDLFFAGQITGVEGYFDSTCIGLLVAHMVADKYDLREINFPPRESAFGALLNGITEEKKHFQPTNINFGLFSPITKAEGRLLTHKDQRRDMQIQKAKISFSDWKLGKQNELAAPAQISRSSQNISERDFPLVPSNDLTP